MGRIAWVLGLYLAVDAAGGGVAVTDDRGVPIKLAAPAHRVVSLAPHITELLFAVGAGAQIVGVSEYSDYPVEARALRRVASAAAIDYETLIGLEPDLVIAWLSGNGRIAIERLEELGIAVFATEPRDLASIAHALRALGTLTGHATQGERVAGKFEARIKALRDRYTGNSSVSVFYEISARPLMTLNGAHMFSDALGVCGGVNVFADLGTLVGTVTLEEVLRRNPAVIMISSTIPNAAAVKAEWAAFAELDAAQGGQIHIVDSDLLNRQTVRLAEGAATLCRLLDQARGT